MSETVVEVILPNEGERTGFGTILMINGQLIPGVRSCELSLHATAPNAITLTVIPDRLIITSAADFEKRLK